MGGFIIGRYLVAMHLDYSQLPSKHHIDESVDIIFKQKPCCTTAIPVSYICLAFLATAKTIKSIVVLLISHEPYSDKHQKAIKTRANNI